MKFFILKTFKESRSTILSCAKLSRTLQLTSNAKEPAKSLFDNIPLEVLKNTIVSSDEQVFIIFRLHFLTLNFTILFKQTRLDSLALICENPKTTELISEIEFELCKQFLYYNIDNSSPSYRQYILGSLKKVY